MMWNSLERKVMDWLGEIDSNPIKPDYGFQYEGTMPLNFEKFPIIQDIYEEGKGSNIVTSYDTDDLDNPTKWILYPTMVEGNMLTSTQVDSLLAENQHFGIYSSQHEMEEADKNIHKYFEDLRDENNKDLDIDGRIRKIDINSVRDK
jgi:hypothetical protein